MKITIARTDKGIPVNLDPVREFLFGTMNGATKEDKKAWNRFWRRVLKLVPGEMLNFEVVFPRYTPFHRRHMKIEQDVFNAQDRFTDFDRFRDWLKIGAGWVEWVPGAKGGIVPLPLSISYAKADEDQFRMFHEKVIDFLRGEHAAPFLWKNLGRDGAFEMMDTILAGFNE
jgi:hypothetical protein